MVNGKIEKPIFILGPHKSGTTLLLSLFDDHSELFAIPFESRILHTTGNWVSYHGKKRYPRDLSFNGMIDEFVSQLDTLNKKEGFFENESEETTLVGKIQINRFRKFMENQKISTLKDMINSYFNALHNNFFNSLIPEGKRVVEKSMENMEFVPILKKMYPGSKFVRIIRNPYSNLVSYRRLIQKDSKNFPRLNIPLISLYQSYHLLYKNKRFLDEDLLIIKYEDLLENPKQTMKYVAKFLEINYEDSLVKPTKLGGLWMGNSSRGKLYTGIDSKNLHRWKHDITRTERYFVGRYFFQILDDFNYDKLPVPSKIKFLVPQWRELPKTYIFNRSINFNLFTRGLN